MSSEEKSVYTLGANNGLVIGIALSAMFLAQSAAMGSLLMTIVGDVIMLAIPFILYALLVRDFDRHPRQRLFSAIWLDGIVTMICGSLILALVCYVFLRFIDPGFMARFIHTCADIYGQMDSPEAKQFASMLEQIVSSHQVPSPIAMAFSLLWLTSFLGSMLSMVIAVIIRYITRRGRTLSN